MPAKKKVTQESASLMSTGGLPDIDLKKVAAKKAPAKTKMSPEEIARRAKAQQLANRSRQERRTMFGLAMKEIKELGVKDHEVCRVINTMPAGEMPNNSVLSKFREKYMDKMRPNANLDKDPRTPAKGDMAVLQLMIMLTEMGVDVTKIDFDHTGRIKP